MGEEQMKDCCCEVCACWVRKKESDKQGECRRHSPTVICAFESVLSFFPKTDPDCMCYEYVATEEKRKEIASSLEDKDFSEIEESGCKEDVNAYLKAGWTLIETCLVNYGEPGEGRSEEMTYCLGWPKKSGETVHPETAEEKRSARTF